MALIQITILIGTNSDIKIMNEVKNQRVQLVFPSDFVCAKDLESKPDGVYLRRDIPEDLMGLDIGPKSIEKFQKIILKNLKIINFIILI